MFAATSSRSIPAVMCPPQTFYPPLGWNFIPIVINFSTGTGCSLGNVTK